VSLYARFDEATLELQGTETKLERVPIVANLRHDQLDSVVTSPGSKTPRHEPDTPEPPRLRAPLSFLFRLAKHLKAQREVVRGKPENFNRPDYNFRLVGNDGNEPTGNEQVQITTRQRGAPLDLIVSRR
jgi:exoribonuclease-2